MDQVLRILVGAQQIARTSSLWRACSVSARPSPKWIARPEGDEGRSLCRDMLVLFALLSVVIWPTNSFLSRPAWAPANGLVSIAAATSYPTKLSMLSVVLLVPHRCTLIVCALTC